MNLTLHQLSIFQAFIQTAGLKRTALELQLSVEEISIQLKQLEQSIGLPLFTTYGNKLQLTDAGKELLIYAEAVEEPLIALKSAIKEIRNVQQGQLNISIFEAANSFLPKFLSAFNRCYEGIDVLLQVIEPHDVYKRLFNGSCDLIIVNQPPVGFGEEITSCGITPTWQCVFRNDQPQSPAARAFCEFAESH